MTRAILAEKPSVARDIARVVGARSRGDGCLSGNGYVVTWAIGHLVALCEPAEMNPAWKSWRREKLPMLPQEWPLKSYPNTRDQFQIVSRILMDDSVSEVICATDAGREGELIFRYIYDAVGCKKPIKRLWISSLTDEAIQAGLSGLRSGESYEPLAFAAKARSRADWLVGMNLSRAASLAWDDRLSVGRVQTPTLAMLVKRELEIEAFEKAVYCELEANFSIDDGEDSKESYRGSYVRSGTTDVVRFARSHNPSAESASQPGPGSEQELEKLMARGKKGSARLLEVTRRERKNPPPQLYDLTSLQRDANKLFGYSAKRTLGLAQALYEQKKLISYPRTDSRHLSADVAANLPRVISAIRGRYDDLSEELCRSEWFACVAGRAWQWRDPLLSKRFVDDSQVTDHHAILPLAVSRRPALNRDEDRVYDLICRRLLMAWHEDERVELQMARTVVEGQVEAEPFADEYLSKGRVQRLPGWRVLEVRSQRRSRSKDRSKVKAEEPQAGVPACSDRLTRNSCGFCDRPRGGREGDEASALASLTRRSWERWNPPASRSMIASWRGR